MTSIIDKEILNDGDVTVEDEELIFCPYNSNNKEATEREVSDILKKYGCLLYTSPSPRDS